MSHTVIPAPTVRKSLFKSLMIQASGGILWGVFFSVMPIAEVLFMGAVVWIPFLIRREIVRSKKYGFLWGFLVRSAVVAGIVFAAASYGPQKYENHQRIQLTANNVTLKELATAARMSGFPEEFLSTQLPLPSNNPTMREVMDSVERRTPYRCQPLCCANNMSVFGGGYVVLISVTPK